MHCHSKILPYISGASIIQNNEVFTTNSAEKKKERHTGESPAVLFKLRLYNTCGDRSLFLFTKNASIMDDPNFKIYVVEKKDFVASEQHIVFEIYKPSGSLFGKEIHTLKFSPFELIALLKELHRIYDIVFPQERTRHVKNIGDVRPYTKRWLRCEMRRLEDAERYEDMAAVKYLINLLEQKKVNNENK